MPTGEHIFISYSKKQRIYARRIADFLLEAGFDVWIDDRIDYGEDWWDVIVSAIQKCAAFVVIMTPESQESRWVKREVMLADNLDKVTFPLLLEGENWPLFVLAQYLDVRGGKLPDDEFVQKLVKCASRRESQGQDVTPTHGEKTKVERTISLEVQRLIDKLNDQKTTPYERIGIGQQLADLDDPRFGVGLDERGVPEIDWCQVPAGPFVYQDNRRSNLTQFYIARYPITYSQFQVFADDPDGYMNEAWWRDLAVWPTGPGEQHFIGCNRPRDSVNWFDAVAYCRWLSDKLGYEVRLPSDQEWEKAARGTDGRLYPWGNDPIKSNAHILTMEKANIAFSRQTAAVGVYPQGASPYGVMDMVGNVWEWCFTAHETHFTSGAGEVARVVRGGAWNDETLTRVSYRTNFPSGSRTFHIGFRVVATLPVV